jgi:hypothetical protein
MIGEIMKELYLCDLNNIFYKQDRNKKYSVYHDPINNNLIIFSPYDDCDIDSVCGGINNQAYSHVIRELNVNRNLVVSWSQVSGTTSDYTIYYNTDVNKLKSLSHDEILENLYSSINNRNACCGFKYTKVKNGVIEKINFENNHLFESVYVDSAGVFH